MFLSYNFVAVNRGNIGLLQIVCHPKMANLPPTF